jgi:hypothetical protein
MERNDIVAPRERDSKAFEEALSSFRKIYAEREEHGGKPWPKNNMTQMAYTVRAISLGMQLEEARKKFWEAFPNR